MTTTVHWSPLHSWVEKKKEKADSNFSSILYWCFKLLTEGADDALFVTGESVLGTIVFYFFMLVCSYPKLFPIIYSSFSLFFICFTKFSCHLDFHICLLFTKFKFNKTNDKNIEGRLTVVFSTLILKPISTWSFFIYSPSRK